MKEADAPAPHCADETVERDILRFLKEAAPHDATGSGKGATDGTDIARLQAHAQEMAVALNALLWRYVDLLEESDRAGSSLDEDEEIRRVLAVLTAAGWPVARPCA